MKNKTVEKWELGHCYQWCAGRDTVAEAVAQLSQLPGVFRAAVAEELQYD